MLGWRRSWCGYLASYIDRSCTKLKRVQGEMKKGLDYTNKPPASRSGHTWRYITIYILTVVLCVQALVLLVWIPRRCGSWRRCFLFGSKADSPFTIEETTIGGRLSARNIKNTLTGECILGHIVYTIVARVLSIVILRVPYLPPQCSYSQCETLQYHRFGSFMLGDTVVSCNLHAVIHV